MKLLKTITPLFWRVIVFACLFVGISGLAGPRIISGDILIRDGFEIYGGLGKAAIFGLIAFALLVRHNKTKVDLQSWRPTLLGWAVVSAVAFGVSWVCVEQLLAGQREAQYLVGAHVGLLVSVACAALACIGISNLVALWRAYRHEIVLTLGIAAAFYVFLLVVYALWPVLASAVLVSVNWLLGLSGLEATAIPPHTLMLDKFGITIAEYCSGIESIALFTSLYAIVGLLDWQRLRYKRYFIIFPFALAFLFMLNIVRVYGLIMAGYYINPEIAFSLFHTYAGLVFFIVYSAVFWAIAYRHIIMTPPKSSDTV